MPTRTVTAPTVEEAKAILTRDFPLADYESGEMEIVQEERKGLLGIGARDATVALKISTDKVKKANVLAQKVVEMLGFRPEINSKHNENSNSIDIEYTGPEAEQMFRKLGDASEDLEFLLSLMVNCQNEGKFLRTRINHTKKNPARESFILNNARVQAKRVAESKKDVHLAPMNPYERSLIHNELKDWPLVMTHSEGSGPDRHIIISFAEDKKPLAAAE